MGMDTGKFRYRSLLSLLVLCALVLSLRLLYLYLADAHRFPINTVKIVANYQHVARAELEAVLSKHLSESFFSFHESVLTRELQALDWTEKVKIERMWPDTVKITLIEKAPVAFWNESCITSLGEVLNTGAADEGLNLPRLSGPPQQQKDVLQIYQKLSKLLLVYDLYAATLQLRENQAWELSLTNGIQLRLGKRDLEKRLQRFCKAYPAVFADKPDMVQSVDLRYAKGMAVKWKAVSK